MTMLFCTNKNDFTHEDLYDGRLYSFPPGQKVELSVEAAQHMFGFQKPDISETLTRLGWAMKYDPEKRTFTDNPQGRDRLKRFVFSEAVMVEKPITEKDDKTLHLKK